MISIILCQLRQIIILSSFQHSKHISMIIRMFSNMTEHQATRHKWSWSGSEIMVLNIWTCGQKCVQILLLLRKCVNFAKIITMDLCEIHLLQKRKKNLSILQQIGSEQQHVGEGLCYTPWSFKKNLLCYFISLLPH